MKRLFYFIPLAGLFIIMTYLTLGLERNPESIPTVLINTPVPNFSLPSIEGQDEGFTNLNLMGQVTLVNIFGSWCVSCLKEHPLLMKIKKNRLVPIYGIDWKEPDSRSGPLWLEREGNPYDKVGNDPNSVAAIAFGVTGAPESFLVDKKGFIRLKRTGPITETFWNKILWPKIKELQMK